MTTFLATQKLISQEDIAAQFAQGKKDFSSVQIPRTNLAGAKLPFIQLKRANLVGANLRNAVLDGANLVGADLSNADLTGASLKQARLIDANLSHACLRHTNFESAFLTRANLQDSNLRGAILHKAHLNEAKLDRAILQEARLSQAYLVKTVLRQTNLKKADLRGAWLTGAILQDAILADAYYSKETHFDVDYPTATAGMKAVPVATLEDLLLLLNSLHSYSLQYLEPAKTLEYWHLSRQDLGNLDYLQVDLQKGFVATAKEELSLEELEQAQKWIRAFMVSCTLVIPEFAKLLSPQ